MLSPGWVAGFGRDQLRLRISLRLINYIKRLCLFVCLFVCMSHSLLSCIKSIWKAGDIVRTVSARAFYIPSFKKFHVRVHAISRNFTQFSRNFGYFSHFWANFNMLGIKKHVLELRNSLVVLSKAISHKMGSQAPKKGQRSPKGAESPSAALCKGWTFWCNAPKYSSVKHIMIVKFIS